MVMANKRRISSFITSVDHDDPQSSYENDLDSPLSGDDLGTAISGSGQPSIKKRRSIKKRVVLVKIGDKDGSRSKGEAYPPSDSWAWRKYGQKPIKGSPYPRGYYRCSSFKGCPAKKQVERNRLDSTTLIITYAYEHNHPLPTTKHHHHNHQLPPAADETPTPSTATATTTTTSTDDSTGNGDPSSPLVDQVVNPFGDQSPTRLEFVGDSSILESLGVEYSWISDISFDETLSSLMGPTCDAADVAVFSPKEEDESLFGDLGELPECSVVFQRIGR